ncbi:hypothetical protein GCM10023335_54840 [Streptomyces siamensis]|uniref:Transposase putative helix-turn-helix domain-containing protein n=1 Tax=Streptomyces siamensis TaxID=1274986 RepID=A0ABP9J709_9ACTN
MILVVLGEGAQVAVQLRHAGRGGRIVARDVADDEGERAVPQWERVVSRTFGCVRLVYNRALEERIRAWNVEQHRISYVWCSAALTEWKKSDDVAAELNSRPRKTLGWETPAERLAKILDLAS